MNEDDFVDPSAPQAPQRPGAALPPESVDPTQPAPYPPSPMHAPAPPGAWVGNGAPVPAVPDRKKRRRRLFAVFAVVGVVGLVAAGFATLFFLGKRVEREVEQAAVDWFEASNRGDDLTLRLDGGEGCLPPDEFASEQPLLEWEPTGVRYELNSDGGGGTSFNSATLDREVVDDFRSGRPAGTDFAVAFGVLRGAGADELSLGMLFIREPEGDWQMCNFGSGS